MSYNFPDCPLPPGAVVWLYFRDSGGETQDLASQRDYGLAYCSHYKLHIDRIFEDGAISGESVAKRDEFGEMIERAHSSKKPLVDGILYWDTKRFARNHLDSQYYKAGLRRRGYTLVSLSDNIPAGEMGILYEAFIEWKAQKDREDISKDSKRGLAFIVGMRDDEGNYLSIVPGRPPTFFKGEKYDTGLRRNDGRARVVQRWIPDPATWDKGKMAWQMRAERASYKEIEQEIDLFPDAIHPDHIYSKIFRNEIYIGRLNYGGRVYEDFVPALATPEQWRKAQTYTYKQPRKGDKFTGAHPKAGRPIYLLSGLCKCLYCQATVWASRNTRPERQTYWKFYICSRKQARSDSCEAGQVSAARLEKTVIEIVNSQVLTADFADRLTEQVNERLADSGKFKRQIEGEQERLGRVLKAIASLTTAIELNALPSLVKQLEGREQERQELERNLERLKAHVQRPANFVDRSLVLKIFTDYRLKLAGEEIKARQFVLKQAVSKIEVGRDKAWVHCRIPLDLYWFYSMPPTENQANPMQQVYEGYYR